MKRAFKVCSNDMNTELNHLETVFTNNNDYINNIIKSEKEKTNTNDEPTNKQINSEKRSRKISKEESMA